MLETGVDFIDVSCTIQKPRGLRLHRPGTYEQGWKRYMARDKEACEISDYSGRNIKEPVAEEILVEGCCDFIGPRASADPE